MNERKRIIARFTHLDLKKVWIATDKDGTSYIFLKEPHWWEETGSWGVEGFENILSPICGSDLPSKKIAEEILIPGTCTVLSAELETNYQILIGAKIEKITPNGEEGK